MVHAACSKIRRDVYTGCAVETDVEPLLSSPGCSARTTLRAQKPCVEQVRL